MENKKITIKRSSEPILFFSKKEVKRITDAVRAAEKNTSGEIRVHLVRKASDDILSQAQKTFQKLGMDATEHRNGVLIFMSVKSRQFAVWADQGIHEKVSADFWKEIAACIETYFDQDRPADGLAEGIRLIGEKLRIYFPYERRDLNELPDEISFSF